MLHNPLNGPSLFSQPSSTILVFVALALLPAGTVFGALVYAQIVGDEAELDRLEVRAEEAMANGDADGASLNIGKAALMAGDLARRHADSEQGRLYRATEALLRAQEHAYRALALFHRAGGQPPASSGVCGSLTQAYQALNHAHDFLSAPPPPALGRMPRLQANAREWTSTLDGLKHDFQCP